MKYIDLLLNIIAGISLWLLRRIGWVYGALTTKDFHKYNRDIGEKKWLRMRLLLTRLN